MLGAGLDKLSSSVSMNRTLRVNRVELGDDEFCFLFFAGGQCCLELRALRSLAALNLGELTNGGYKG